MKQKIHQCALFERYHAGIKFRILQSQFRKLQRQQQ